MIDLSEKEMVEAFGIAVSVLGFILTVYTMLRPKQKDVDKRWANEAYQKPGKASDADFARDLAVTSICGQLPKGGSTYFLKPGELAGTFSQLKPKNDYLTGAQAFELSKAADLANLAAAKAGIHPIKDAVPRSKTVREIWQNGVDIYADTKHDDQVDAMRAALASRQRKVDFWNPGEPYKGVESSYEEYEE